MELREQSAPLLQQQATLLVDDASITPVANQSRHAQIVGAAQVACGGIAAAATVACAAMLLGGNLLRHLDTPCSAGFLWRYLPAAVYTLGGAATLVWNGCRVWSSSAHEELARARTWKISAFRVLCTFVALSLLCGLFFGTSLLWEAAQDNNLLDWALELYYVLVLPALAACVPWMLKPLWVWAVGGGATMPISNAAPPVASPGTARRQYLLITWVLGLPLLGSAATLLVIVPVAMHLAGNARMAISVAQYGSMTVVMLGLGAFPLLTVAPLAGEMMQSGVATMFLLQPWVWLSLTSHAISHITDSPPKCTVDDDGLLLLSAAIPWLRFVAVCCSNFLWFTSVRAGKRSCTAGAGTCTLMSPAAAVPAPPPTTLAAS